MLFSLLGISQVAGYELQVTGCALGFSIDNHQSTIINLKPLYLLDGEQPVQVVDENRIVI